VPRKETKAATRISYAYLPHWHKKRGKKTPKKQTEWTIGRVGRKSRAKRMKKEKWSQ